MSKPYDATSKDLIEADPGGWVTFLGCPADASDVRLVDADVSTVTTDADKVIRVETPFPWLLHLDIQAGWERGMDRRLSRYNALLHAVPVASVVVILRAAANMTALTGVMPVRPPVGPAWEFRYEVLRVWERPAADFLAASPCLAPFAPLAAVRRPELPAVIDAMRGRLDPLPDRELAAKLWTACYVLMGMRYDEALADKLLEGVIRMEESVTYQAILRRGEQRGGAAVAQRLVLHAGRQKLGPPPPAVEAVIGAITDTDRLDALNTRILSVSTWGELLQQE